jgi:hypothetical protein
MTHNVILPSSIDAVREVHSRLMICAFGARARPDHSVAIPGALLLLRQVRHDVSHLHRLTCRQLLNSEDDLVIRCAGRVLEQFPKALHQLALVFRRPASPAKKRERRGRRCLSSREAASRSIILKDYVDPGLWNPGILRMQRRQFAGEFDLRLATQYSGLRLDSVSGTALTP